MSDQPVVESTLILQALLHCAVDGGLSAVFWGLDEVHEGSVQYSLPQGDGEHKVAPQFGPDDSRVEAVSCYSGACRKKDIMPKVFPVVYILDTVSCEM